MKKNDHETHEDRTVVKETHSGGTTLNLIDRWHAEAEKMEMIRCRKVSEVAEKRQARPRATTKQQNNKTTKQTKK